MSDNKQTSIEQVRWAIKTPVGYFCCFNHTRSLAIKSYTTGTSGSWRYHYKRGCRAVKISIQEAN